MSRRRVLDGDDRLGGEVLDQLDLLVGKRTNFLAEDADEAEEFITFQQWNRNAGSNATYLYCLNYCRMAFVIRSRRCEVGNASGLFGSISFAKSGARRGIKGLASACLGEGRIVRGYQGNTAFITQI